MRKLDINLILIYLLLLFGVIGSLAFFEPLKVQVWSRLTPGHLLEPILNLFGILFAYILIFHNIDSRGHTSFLKDKKFILFAVFLTSLLFLGGGSHWVANIINEYKAELNNKDLKNIVHFFDELFGHMVPFAAISIAGWSAVLLESNRPMDIKYSNPHMWVNLIVSLILGIAWALILIEGSSGLFGTLILIPINFIVVFIALIKGKWGFWDMKKLPFLHYVLVSSISSMMLLLLWFWYYGSFKQISEII